MRFKTGAHSIYDLHIYLVFVAKYRRKVLSIPVIQDLRSIFAEICARHEADLVECDGENDHVHLLIHYPPKLALSKLINHLKGTSSRYLREDRPEISGCYKGGVLWSLSYFAGSWGAHRFPSLPNM
jgi:putative transposase